MCDQLSRSMARQHPVLLSCVVVSTDLVGASSVFIVAVVVVVVVVVSSVLVGVGSVIVSFVGFVVAVGVVGCGAGCVVTIVVVVALIVDGLHRDRSCLMRRKRRKISKNKTKICEPEVIEHQDQPKKIFMLFSFVLMFVVDCCVHSWLIVVYDRFVCPPWMDSIVIVTTKLISKNRATVGG